LATAVRSYAARIGVAGVERRIQGQRQVIDRRAVPYRGIVEADAGRDAVAELDLVLDVVGAGVPSANGGVGNEKAL
jgi:hypothetical protein